MNVLTKSKFVIFGVLVCIVILVHLELQLSVLLSSNKNDVRRLHVLEDKVDEAKRLSLVGRKIETNENRSELTVEDKLFTTDGTSKNELISVDLHRGARIKVNISSNISDDQTFRQRLKIANGVKELWWYLRARLKQSDASVNIDDISHQVKVIMAELENLENHPAFAAWKKTTAAELSRLVQKRFHHLQNPEDCQKSRKLICNLNKPCGYGCLIHHIGYCFILAYATQRTMILDSNSGFFAENKGWDSVFLPLSDTCTRANTNGVTWSAHNENALEVNAPFVEMLSPRPPQMPMAFPKDMSEKLLAFHGNPFVWWAGQVFKYLLRPNKQLTEFINLKRTELGFKKPVVGYVRKWLIHFNFIKCG